MMNHVKIFIVLLTPLITYVYMCVVGMMLSLIVPGANDLAFKRFVRIPFDASILPRVQLFLAGALLLVVGVVNGLMAIAISIWMMIDRIPPSYGPILPSQLLYISIIIPVIVIIIISVIGIGYMYFSVAG